MSFNIFNFRNTTEEASGQSSDLSRESTTNDLHRDKFKINRRKFEHMLTDEAPEPGNVFFQKIMEDTNTVISWPSALNVGSKSKRNPHVVIAGTRLLDVQIAKDRIVHVLNATSNKVTMKMDVSYTHHSHIIGKGGLNIKRVMEETRCHIHFPDSNRSNDVEKNNQVSIAGDVDGVEKARTSIRNLAPLTFCFGLPVHNNSDNNTPYVVKVQEQYNVRVMFLARPKPNATIVLVRGAECEAQQVKQATRLLVDYMCNGLVSQTSIQMSMEISPNYHAKMIGKHCCNLKAISEGTNTQIAFPDPANPSAKKSNVTIRGNVNNVYSARQQLMGLLPLVLLFDLPDDTNLPLTDEQIEELQSVLEVRVSFRAKVKQATFVCVVKGIERCASDIYKARSWVLDIIERNNKANILAAYFAPAQNDNTKTVASNRTTVQQPQTTYDYGSMASSRHHPLGQCSSSSLSTECDGSSRNSTNSTEFSFGRKLSTSPVINTRWSEDKDDYIVSAQTPSAGDKWGDLSSLLSCYGLEDYVGLLTSQRIDLTAFCSLNDDGLAELGVFAFGARRKMLLIISELNKRANVFTAAPGAGRNSSASTSRSDSLMDW